MKRLIAAALSLLLAIAGGKEVLCQEVYDNQEGIVFDLKTNLLYDVALVPNVGLEFHLGRGWSVGADWNFAWWSNDSKYRYWRIYGGELNLRKYFGRRKDDRPLIGHHVGLYAQGFTYDFELGQRGVISDFSYGTGLDYGYTLPIATRLNLDFSVGFGYLGGDYKVYDPDGGCYVWKETRQRHWYGPTRAEVSLAWVFGLGKNEEGGLR